MTCKYTEADFNWVLSALCLSAEKDEVKGEKKSSLSQRFFIYGNGQLFFPPEVKGRGDNVVLML